MKKRLFSLLLVLPVVAVKADYGLTDLELDVESGLERVKDAGRGAMRDVRAAFDLSDASDLYDADTVASAVRGNSDLKTLNRLLEEYGLERELSRSADDLDAYYIFFAPTNKAFAKLDLSKLSKDDVRSVLQNHVVKVSKDQKNKLDTLNAVTARKGAVLHTKNGVVIVTKKVSLPADLKQAAKKMKRKAKKVAGAMKQDAKKAQKANKKAKKASGAKQQETTASVAAKPAAKPVAAAPATNVASTVAVK